MGDGRGKNHPEPDKDWGTTSTGVQYDFRPSPEDKGARKNHDIKKFFAAHKKLIQKAAITLAVIAAFAGLSIGLGDSLWDRILPPLQSPTSMPSPAITAAPTAVTTPATPNPTEVASLLPTAATAILPPTAEQAAITVWVPNSGSRYHLTSDCSGMKNATEVSLDEAKADGFTPCKRCNPPE